MSQIFHPTTFGEALTAARKGRGLTQDQLADALGVGRSTIARWESLVSATGHGTGMTDAAMAQLKAYFGKDLLPPRPAPSDVTLAYWAGRVEQVAKHMELVLQEQRAIVSDMGVSVDAETRAQRALEATQRAKAARQSGGETSPRRQAQG